jgi:broad specificity phosphatase PhoE
MTNDLGPLARPGSFPAVSRIWLVRHAPHADLGRVLTGRLDDGGLTRHGRKVAAALADNLGQRGVVAVDSSPRQRARETAEAIARSTGCTVCVTPALDEVNYGAWSGLTFAELAGDKGWQRWNAHRSSARPPQGECIAEVRMRLYAHLAQRAPQASGGIVIMVTHAEVIRTLLLDASGLPADAWSAIDVEPASVTRVILRGDRIALVELAGGGGAA